jgi:hypothetical protein
MDSKGAIGKAESALQQKQQQPLIPGSVIMTITNHYSMNLTTYLYHRRLIARVLQHVTPLDIGEIVYILKQIHRALVHCQHDIAITSMRIV